jgi:hypothetical protein
MQWGWTGSSPFMPALDALNGGKRELEIYKTEERFGASRTSGIDAGAPFSLTEGPCFRTGKVRPIGNIL